MRNSTIATTAFALMLTASLALRPASAMTGFAVEKENFAEAVKTFHEALRVNDVQTFMSFIADDVVLMAPGEPTIRGKAAVRAWYEGFLAQFHTSTLVFNHEEVFMGNGFAVELASFEWGLVPTRGGAASVDRGSFMQVWKKQADGQWRFAREIFNSSVPAAAGTK